MFLVQKILYQKISSCALVIRVLYPLSHVYMCFVCIVYIFPVSRSFRYQVVYLIADCLALNNSFLAFSYLSPFSYN